MASKGSGTCEPAKVPLSNLAELNRIDVNSGSESADRFNESAKRRVNTGLMLQRWRVQLLRQTENVRRTQNRHFVAQGGNGQPRTFTVRADGVLTYMSILGRQPGVFALMITRRICELRESSHTSIRI